MIKMRYFKSALILAALLIAIFGTTAVHAGFPDVQQGAGYSEALGRVSSLGIMSGDASGMFNPDSPVTREQFTKILIVASGAANSAEILKGTSIFPDVEADRWSNGYINAALNKGFVTGMSDGMFHPDDTITFAQACTALVRALGYTDQDVSSLWPRNYIEKARALGLTDGMEFGANDNIPRWGAAVMVDRLLVTNIKGSGQAAAKTFAEAAGLYTECTILADSTILEKLTARQVMTDKGIYYLADGVTGLELGNSYMLATDGDTIKSVFTGMKTLTYLAITGVTDNSITYLQDGRTDSMVLPDKTTYYYNGAKQNYDNLKNILNINSSIIFAQNKNKTGYDYAIIIDPVYSKPEIALNYNPASYKAGSMKIDQNAAIIRGGELVDVKGIEEKDVVYKVTDLRNTYSYYLAVDSKVEGKLLAVLPNRLSPRSVKVNDKSYELSRHINAAKLGNDSSAVRIEDNVVLLLGYDGKVVDIVYPSQDTTSSYALVLGTSKTISTKITDFGKEIYTVKLMFTDGTTASYKIDYDAVNYKGKLVGYSLVYKDGEEEAESVIITPLVYPGQREYTVNKDEMKLGEYDVKDDVRIINIVSNEPGTDVQASIIKWTDMKNGLLQAGKVQYISTTGDFEDIDFILVDDAFEQRYKVAFVKRVEQKGGKYNYTLLVDGKEYVYNNYYASVEYHSAVKVKLANNAVNYILGPVLPEITISKIQLMDEKRVKINNTIYHFKDSTTIYYRDYTGVVSVKGIEDIDVRKQYARVSVYLDKPVVSNGKVEYIYISEI